MFIDESSFYPLSLMAAHIYAPQGEAPVLSHWLIRAYLSVIGGVTPQDKLYFRIHNRAIKRPDVLRFLDHLLRQLPGSIPVQWDRASIHWCQTGRDQEPLPANLFPRFVSNRAKPRRVCVEKSIPFSVVLDKPVCIRALGRDR